MAFTWYWAIVVCVVVVGYGYEENNSDRIAEIHSDADDRWDNSSSQNVYKKRIPVVQPHLERPKRTAYLKNQRRLLSSRRTRRFGPSIVKITIRTVPTSRIHTDWTRYEPQEIRQHGLIGLESSSQRRRTRCRPGRCRG